MYAEKNYRLARLRGEGGLFSVSLERLDGDGNEATLWATSKTFWDFLEVFESASVIHVSEKFNGIKVINTPQRHPGIRVCSK